ncbi:uncharacterized protein LOC131434795 isoform X2 [Malaya genurostris]|uniref:uncharacterized protein LOC131434795 isoform X2 n=1 Tax=Malaya genurostris TaxID=325434 RepID=UPI0026F392FA|nr:uncharacterized protein LOC131434795 isoform X2 [Malaya genurostris]
MESSPLKNNRKVRFSLPENNVATIPSSVNLQKQRLSHGTLQYVNGTLVSQPTMTGSSPAMGGHVQVRPGKPKEANTKIVLHLRPSTGIDKLENMEVCTKPSSSSLEKGHRKAPKSGVPKLETRSFRTLPQINQKFPSSEELNHQNNTGRDVCHRHKSVDDFGSKPTDPNNNVQQMKKQNVMLRSISNLSSNAGTKLPSSRPRSKSLGRLNTSKTGKTLISSHLQQHENNVTIKVQESSPARRAFPAENNELNSNRRHREQINNGGGKDFSNGASTRPKSQYAKCNFLTVPEFSDRFDGMETAVSTSLAEFVDEGEMEEAEEDDEEGNDGEGNPMVVDSSNRTNSVDAIALKKSGSAVAKRRRSQGGTMVESYGYGEGDTKAPSVLNDAGFKCIQDTNLGRDKNVLQFWDFVERWRANRALKKLDSIHGVIADGSGINGSGKPNGSSTAGSESSSSVQIGGSGKSDVKSPTLSSRIRALRMSMEQVPTVTTLLRASRDANEHLLKEVFRDILENGISRENLNSTDRSGRTAISYICSTNLTNFLELFLQLPGIDVNKPDNEGNTPLHFAAQAGLSDIVNMLITKCRSLVIDPKNNLGFTPLMKAALQGRTRCAKLLLFAGASPVETDTGRGFRAEQWARFCGRHSCAETIEQCARARLLDKSTPCGKWSHDVNLPIEKNALKVTRSSSITTQTTSQNGIRSKFRKVFPFNFSSKDKQVSKEADENYTKDLVNYLKSATICVSGPALSANKKIIQSLIRPLEVPKITAYRAL